MNILYPDLEQIYKQHVTCTHESALQAVFRAGVMHIAPNDSNRELTLEEEFAQLQQEHERLLMRYDALNAKFNINQPKTEIDPAMQKKLVDQAVGMGTVFVENS